MKVGDIIRTPSVQHHFSNGECHGHCGYSAGKGDVFVLCLLGVEAKDGSNPLDTAGIIENFEAVASRQDKIDELETTLAATQAALKAAVAVVDAAQAWAEAYEHHGHSNHTDDGALWNAVRTYREEI